MLLSIKQIDSAIHAALLRNTAYYYTHSVSIRLNSGWKLTTESLRLPYEAAHHKVYSRSEPPVLLSAED